MSYRLAANILSADLAHLEDEVREAVAAGYPVAGRGIGFRRGSVDSVRRAAGFDGRSAHGLAPLGG